MGAVVLSPSCSNDLMTWETTMHVLEASNWILKWASNGLLMPDQVGVRDCKSGKLEVKSREILIDWLLVSKVPAT